MTVIDFRGDPATARSYRVVSLVTHADITDIVWADHFDGSLEDVFELQDKVAVSVAGVIEPTLQAAEAQHSVNRPTSDVTAYDLYLRAYALFWSSARHVREALCLLEDVD